MSRALPKCDCGEFIRWIVMRGGQRVAVDMGPDPEKGSVWVDGQGRGVFLPKADIERARAAGEELLVQHRSTCRLVERRSGPSADQMSLDL